MHTKLIGAGSRSGVGVGRTSGVVGGVISGTDVTVGTGMTVDEAGTGVAGTRVGIAVGDGTVDDVGSAVFEGTSGVATTSPDSAAGTSTAGTSEAGTTRDSVGIADSGSVSVGVGDDKASPSVIPSVRSRVAVGLGVISTGTSPSVIGAPSRSGCPSSTTATGTPPSSAVIATMPATPATTTTAAARARGSMERAAQGRRDVAAAWSTRSLDSSRFAKSGSTGGTGC